MDFSQKMIKLRIAKREDSESIIKLEKEWTKEKISIDMNPYLPKEINKAIKEKRILIAKDEDKTIGFLFFEFQDKKTCELDAIFVIKEYRSKKLGNLLMQKFLSLKEVKKVDKIYLLADSIYENKLIRFYNKYGFKKVAIRMLKQK